MANEQRMYYIGYEVGFKGGPCPLCKTRNATAHGLLYKEPPPDGPDDRRPVGEVYLHDEGDDCQLLAESERPKS